jgi:hypothetical protein
MFKYLFISIVIVPVLLGAKAASVPGGPRGLRVLIAGWVLYSVFWVGMLYYLKHRWVG